jgi:hypothetical protein
MPKENLREMPTRLPGLSGRASRTSRHLTPVLLVRGRKTQSAYDLGSQQAIACWVVSPWRRSVDEVVRAGGVGGDQQVWVEHGHHRGGQVSVGWAVAVDVREHQCRWLVETTVQIRIRSFVAPIPIVEHAWFRDADSLMARGKAGSTAVLMYAGHRHGCKKSCIRR